VVDETGFFEEGRALGRSGPPVLRHRGPDRQLPDRRVPRLCLGTGAGVDRPGAVSPGSGPMTGPAAGPPASATRSPSPPNRHSPAR
jgi:hypothetical protein